MKVFKKGSLVPRRLGIVVASNKKAQHWLVFGVDVTYDGRSVVPVNAMGERDALIVVKHGMSAPRKNGTRQKSGFSMGSNWSVSSEQNTFTGVYSASFGKTQ